MSRLQALWQRLWQAPRSRWLLGVPLGGFAAFVGGVIFWGGFNWSLEITNTEAFCISCHEMREFVFEEYKQTSHYANASGVRASCPDCHVPRPWVYKVARKIRATNELYHKLLGTISTREKFEAKRGEMAQHVWDTMKANDSRECRNCHHADFMQRDLQGRRAALRHDPEKLRESGETCIDCHKGVAHELPAPAELSGLGGEARTGRPVAVARH